MINKFNGAPESCAAQHFGVIIKQFPSHSLAKTFLVERWDNRRVVVKASGHPIGRNKVLTEARHLMWLANRSKQYPRLITYGEAGGCTFVMLPFFKEATLSAYLYESRASLQDCAAICARLFHHLYEPRREDFSTDDRLFRTIFRAAYVDRLTDRIRRVEQAFDSLGLIPASQSVLIIDGKEYPRPLKLLTARSAECRGMTNIHAFHDLTAWHGDLTPMNVLYGREKGADKFIFIDPRGDVIWQKGQPRWDPAYDAGKLCFYFEAWEPVSNGRISLVPGKSTGANRAVFDLNGSRGSAFTENFFFALSSSHPTWGSSAFQLRGRFAAACHCLADSWSRMAIGNHMASLAEYLLGVLRLDAFLLQWG